MAQAPTPDEINTAREVTRLAFEEKQEAQLKEGKGFDVPADGHGAGVIPEAIWVDQKAQS